MYKRKLKLTSDVIITLKKFIILNLGCANYKIIKRNKVLI